MTTPATLRSRSDRKPILEFAHAIETQAQTGVDGAGRDREFVPKDALKQYWTNSRIRAVVKFLSLETIKAEYLCVLSTLVFIDRVDCITEFTDHGLRDNLLPFVYFPKDRWPLQKVHCELFQEFSAAQWRFFPLIFQSNLLEGLLLHTDHVLPWQKTPFATSEYGAGSTVHKVVIAKGYNRLSDSDSRENKNTFILKTYSEQKLYHDERLAYTALKNLPNNHVSGFYASFVQNDAYHLILEYADGNTLLDLFREAPPSTARDIHDFWTSFTGIFEGVYRIHQLTKYYDLPKTSHFVINPGNIVMRRLPDSSPYQFEAKITNFRCSDAQSWNFDVHNKADTDQRSGHTYLAPECYHSEAPGCVMDKFTAETNIFALGCLTSDAAVWVAFGHSGQDTYRQARREESKKLPNVPECGYGGCYHNGADILQAVRDMHRKVRQRLAPCENITVNIISVAEEFMLRGQASSRGNARDIKQRFGHALDGYKSPSGSSPPTYTGNISRRGDLPLKRLENFDSMPDPEQPILQTMSNPSPAVGSAPVLLASRTASCELVNRSSETSIFPPQVIQPDFPRSRNQQSSVDMSKVSVQASSSSPHSPLSLNQRHQPARLSAPASQPSGKPWLSSDEALEYRRAQRKHARVNPATMEKIQGLKRALQGRHHLFLIDDSTTMASRSDEVLEAFEVMSYIAKQIDPNSIELVFGSSCTVVEKRSATTPLVKLLKNHQYSANKSLMELKMDEFTDRVLMPRLRGVLRGRLPRMPAKPISVFVFTDGSWGKGLEKAAGVQRPIQRLMTRLIKYQIPRTTVMFQFIRFGNGTDGQRYLDYLDNFGREQGFDIVDTKPWPDGDLWLMFVGSLCEDADGQDSDPKVAQLDG